MPRPNDSPDVQASKTLSYILRHGAEKEGLAIRSDGFIKLNDVLARPKLRDVDLETVLRIVEENAKQRFEVLYGYDPSPPRPKKKGQGKAKARFKPPPSGGEDGEKREVDAARIDDIRDGLADTAVKDSPPLYQELPLVTLSVPSETETGGSNQTGEYFIRATQGHSLNLESVGHLTPVLDDEDGRRRAGLLVHGTRWELWETLKTEGLSRMARQHIHLAPALSDHIITPRPSSTLYIYLDLAKVLGAGIPVYTSANGVVLTPGNEHGLVRKEMWSKAERKLDGKRVDIWQDGEDVTPDAQ